MNPAALATPRTTLRLLGPGDEALYCALYTDPAVMARVGPPLAPAVALAGFRAARRLNAAADGRQRRWSVSDAATGQALGLLALLGDPGGRPRAEVGILLLPLAQGRGIGRELIGAACAIAFGPGGWGLEEAWARHRPGHAAAAALLAATGFEPGPALAGATTALQARSRWLARMRDRGGGGA